MAGLRPRAYEERLDPVRPRAPRPRSLLRHTATAALLALAAAVLLLDPALPSQTSAECRGRPTTSPTASAPSEDGRRADERRSPPVPAGMVGVPIQLAEPATAAVARPGDRVDVIARVERPAAGTPDDPPGDSASPGQTEIVLATAALVLAVDSHPERSPDEGIVYLAMRKAEAQRVARTAPDVAIGITVRPR